MTTDVETVPDAELVTAVTRGDTAALTVLYDRHASVVFRAAFRRLGDRQLAEEVVQDVWLTLWDRGGLFDARQGSLPGWLCTIARNRATDRMRSLGRRPGALPLSAVFATDDDPDRALAAGSLLASGGSPSDPELVVDELALRDTMTAALADLSTDERTVLELGYYGELSQSEIADRLGIPLGTVKTRTRRALLRLRRVFAPNGELLPADEVPDGPR
ncbi:MAG: sigma-70 family RNA polymerase sigma factor [Candidatus Limnocylindrales bacterium]